ncbi:MAG: hypothetical protein GXP14_13680 [Gammaproteobacteria bacterium]|nr:hypothetical protein [Gammaproteobacteria bacterium]
MTSKQRTLSGSRKVYRPLLHKALTRLRLFELLDNAAARPVTAVLAPPGYGKTTLVSNYVESKQIMSVWYCVDEGDTDLTSFFVHFTYAIKQATAKRRKTIPSYQPENVLNIKSFSRHYFQAVYQRLDQPFYLIFDDIHECSSQQWVDVITIAIEELPVNGRIFILGRHALPGEFSRLHLNQLIFTLREKDLHFSNQELIQLASIHDINALSQEQCNKLQKMMAGWAAGLTLLLTRSDNIDNTSLHAFETQEELFKYFTHEVLRHIDNETLGVLYCTCYLSDVPIEHAVVLTQNPQVGHILQKLHDQRYFTYRTTDTEIVYRYHPLFRTLLIAQSKKTLSEKNLQYVLDTSVQLLEKEGALEAAVTLLVLIADGARLTQFTMLHAEKLMASNRMQLLMKCLQHIPVETILASGWLLYWRGICLVAMRPPVARQDFILAEKFFASKQDATGQCLSLVGVMDSYILERNEFSSLDEWIKKADQLRLLFDQKVTIAALNALTLSMFSALLHRAPNHQNFDLWLKRIDNIPMTELSPGLKIKRQLSLILHRLWQGDFYRAEIYHSILEKQLGNVPEHVPNILWHIIHSGFLWMTTAKAKESLAIAKEGLERIKEYNLPLLNIGLLTHATAAALMAHNNDEAKKLLKIAAPHINDSGQTHLALYHNLHTTYSFRSNDKKTAYYHAEAFLQAATASGLPFFQSAAHFSQAQLCMLKGDIKKTRYHMNIAKDIALHSQSYFHQFQVQLLSAIFDWFLGQQDSALSYLKTSLLLAKKYNLLTGLWVCERELSHILTQALRHDVESATAQRIIGQRRLIPKEPFYDVDCWPWPIRIYTLGRFEIYIDGKRLESPGRNRPKVYALLKTLIAFGGSHIREEVISEVVWPDADGDAAHQLFDTTLFRLRKILGLRDVIINREGMLSLNKKLCWLDIWALDLEINTLSLSIKDKRATENCIKKHEDFLSRDYYGDFLYAEDSFPIVIQQRQKIRSKLLFSLYQLANYWLCNNGTKEAERCLNKITSIFPQEEKAYQMLMKLFRSQDRFSDAASTYHVCKQVLMIELSVKPSTETECEYRKLPNFGSR